MAEQPRIGLQFDQGELRDGLQTLSGGRLIFEKAGDAAATASAKTKGLSASVKEAGESATTAGKKRESAANSASRADAASLRAMREVNAQLRIMNEIARTLQLEQSVRGRMSAVAGAQEVAAARQTAAAIRSVEQAEAARNARSAGALAQAKSIADFRTRMERQRQSEVGASAAAEEAANRKTSAEALRQTRMIAEFRSRMETQRRAEVATTARAEIAAAKQAEAATKAAAAARGAHGWGRNYGSGGGGGGGGGGSSSGSGDGDRRSILAKTAAMLGLGTAYDLASKKGAGFFQTLGQIRVGLLNARFAAALFIGALTLGPVAAMADQMVALEARTALYVKRGSDVPTIMTDIYRTAQAARQPLAGIATLYTRLAPLGDTLGRSQSQLLRVVETVAKSFTLGGAAASEATASAQQFAQALSSNRFGGDELRSVAENAPVLLAALADGVNKINPALNLNAATFIKWAQAGNANSEIMVRALENARGKIDAMFKTMPVTVSQGVTVLGNAIQFAVGEIDKLAGAGGGRLSTEIAQTIAQFAAFVESEGFINGVVTALEALRNIISFVSKVVEVLAQNFKILAVAIATVFVVSKLIPVFEALAFSIKIYGVAQTIAVNATAASTAAMTALRVAMTALVAASPLILFVALTAALMYLNTVFANGEKAAKGYKDGLTGLGNALDAAILRAKAYGNDTTKLTAILEKSVGIQRDLNDTTDEGTRLAQARAEMDKQMAIAQLSSAAATLRGVEADARKAASIKRVFASVLEGMAKIASVPMVGQALMGLILGGPVFGNLLKVSPLTNGTGFSAFADKLKSDADKLDATANQAAAGVTAAEDAMGIVRGMDFTATEVEDGSGVSTLGAKDDKAGKAERGMKGALKRIADLRAELTTMQKEVAATEVGFFGPGGLDALEVERASLEALANYGVQSLDAITNARIRAAAATEVQLAADVALKRLETDRVTQLINQRKEAENQAEAFSLQAELAEYASNEMRNFYASGRTGSAEYAATLRDIERATIDSEIATEALSIAREFGVGSIKELNGALRENAQKLLDARTEVIRMTAAEEAAAAVRAGSEDRAAEISDLNAYAKAVDGGTRALLDYQLQAERNAALKDSKGKNIEGITADVDALASARLAKALADQQLAVSEQEIQVRLGSYAREEGHYALILQYMAAHKDATIEIATKAVDAATRELALRRQIANVQANIQDDIRSVFIRTGKMDFSAIADGMAEQIRTTLYDKVFAKPIELVVNAVVDFVSKGLDNLIGSFLQMAGPWGQAAAVALAVVAQTLGKERISDKRDVKLSSEEMQALQGTGSVLGDLAAQSESLANAMDLVADHTNKNLEYSNGMLNALRKIQSGIGSLTSVIARQISMSTGAFDTSGLGLGEKGKGPGLGTAFLTVGVSALLPGLFGSKKTTELLDQGLNFNSQSLQDILNGGINGSTYQDVSTNTKKKFFGITYSNKTNLSTQSGALDAELATQIGLVIGSLKDGAVEAANVLGIAGAEELLRAMQINIGRISFKDMNAEEIQAALNGVFGKIADDMATRLLPIIGQFQEAGEGAFETLTRLARNYQIVDVTLESIGKTFGTVGVTSIAARERLIALAGGIDAFVEKTTFFADNFLTAQERLGPIQRRLTAEMQRLGITGVTTRDQFKQLVLGMDLSTEGGATMYAALLDLAPAFAAVTEGADKAREELIKIFDFAQGLLTGNLSPLAPVQKLDIERMEYESLLARSQGGDVAAMEQLNAASSEYLTAAQQFYGSSPDYAAIFSKVYNELVALSGTAVQDPVVAVIETEVQRLIDAINAGFLLIANDPDQLPDAGPIPGDGTGTTAGGRGGPNREFDEKVILTLSSMAEGITALTDTVAKGTGAVVASNDAGYQKLGGALIGEAATETAFKGGRVRQVASVG